MKSSKSHIEGSHGERMCYKPLARRCWRVLKRDMAASIVALCVFLSDVLLALAPDISSKW